MADFAPELRDRDPQDYMRASRGWDDDTIAVGIKGAADIFKMGVSLMDETNKREIKEEARASVDETRDRSIAELHSITRPPAQGGQAPVVPGEIARDAARLSTMKQAVEQGSYRESNYWGALDATTRKLRAKYPGYRDHIDETMKQLTGSDPANALVRELRQDAQRLLSTTDSSEKRRIELLEKMKDPPIGAENMTYEQLLPFHLNTRRQDYALEYTKARIETQGAKDKFDLNEVGKTASTEWGVAVSQLTKKTHPVIGASLAQLDELTERFGSGDPDALRDPKRISEYMVALNRAGVELEGRFNSFMNAPQAHLKQKSYAMVLGDEKVKEIKANQVDGVLARYKTFLTDGNVGVLKHAAQINEVMRDVEMQRALGDPVLRSVHGLSKAFGPAAIDIIMSKDAKTLNAFQLSMQQYMINATSNPTTPATSFQSEVEKAIAKSGEVKPEVIHGALVKSTKLLSEPNNPLTAPQKAKTIDSLYGAANETFIGMVNGDPKFGGKATDPQKVFSIMANPAVAKSVYQFSKDSGDPSHWEKYQNWVIKQTYSLNLANINTVAVSMRNAPAVEIKFDPVRFQFDVADRAVPIPPTSQTPGLAALRYAADLYDRSGTQGIKDAVKRVNASFAPIRDIVTLRGEKDPTAFALSVMTNMAFEGEKKYGAETISQSLITKLGKVLYESNPNFKENIAPGPYKRSSEAPQGEAIDLTPSIFRGAGKALENVPSAPLTGLTRLRDWAGRLFPTREEVDRERNRARQMGTQGAP